MKKLLLIAVLFVGGIVSAQQITVKRVLNFTTVTDVINDGDIFYFTSLEDPGNTLGYKVYNNSASNTRVKAKVISMTNASGTDLQLCLGDICLNTIAAGNSYPSNPINIPANGSTGNFDHLYNSYPGTNTDQIVEYVIKVYQMNASNVEVGNSVTFTYRYTSVLANETFTAVQNDVTLKSSIVSSTLDIRAAKNVMMEMFDVNGKSVRRENLTTGDHSIDVSDLSSGMYILSFNSETNQKTTAKFVKK